MPFRRPRQGCLNGDHERHPSQRSLAGKPGDCPLSRVERDEARISPEEASRRLKRIRGPVPPMETGKKFLFSGGLT
jgi:hypothetical protein